MNESTRAHAAIGGQASGYRLAAVLVCLFHLNLAFSSLPAERRPEIVQRCYWPMLELARRTPFPIAFEAPGWTLEQIAAIDPEWIAAARELIAAGRAELVGSSYAQCAAPLLPAEVNRWNLRLGLEVYERAARRAPPDGDAVRAGVRARAGAAVRAGRLRGDRRRLGQRVPLPPGLAARHAARAAAGRRRRRQQPAGHLERVDRVPEVPALRPRRARPRALRRVRARRRSPTAARCCCTPTTPRCSTTGRAASPPSRPRGRASGTASPRR